MATEFVYKLRHPYNSPIGAKSLIEVVRLRTLMTVDDQIAVAKAGGTEAESERALVARCCGLLPEEIGPMAVKDFRRLQTELGKALVDDEDPKDV